MYDELLANLAILVLSGFVGFAVISKVPNTFHTPLMSGTNAIHGIVVLGALVVFGQVEHPSLAVQTILFVAAGLRPPDASSRRNASATDGGTFYGQNPNSPRMNPWPAPPRRCVAGTHRGRGRGGGPARPPGAVHQDDRHAAAGGVLQRRRRRHGGADRAGGVQRDQWLFGVSAPGVADGAHRGGVVVRR